MLWPLILWNPDLFTIVQKKALWFFFNRDVTVFHEGPLTCFPSCNITKNAETYPMDDFNFTNFQLLLLSQGGFKASFSEKSLTDKFHSYFPQLA